MSMVILDIAELIPSNHLLRKINQRVSPDFIYDLVAPYYPANDRLSVDPVDIFKMLLVGYLYGIQSERRLAQEIQLNIAYRWFCGIWNDRRNSWACLWRKLLWTEGMALVLFTGGVALLRITGYIPAIRFPNDLSNMDFDMIRNRIHLFTQ